MLARLSCLSYLRASVVKQLSTNIMLDAHMLGCRWCCFVSYNFTEQMHCDCLIFFTYLLFHLARSGKKHQQLLTISKLQRLIERKDMYLCQFTLEIAMSTILFCWIHKNIVNEENEEMILTFSINASRSLNA